MADATRCYFCEERITGTQGDVWRLVIGWEKRATAESRRGGSDITLRKPYGEGDGATFACGACIRLCKRGIDPRRQGTML